MPIHIAGSKTTAFLSISTARSQTARSYPSFSRSGLLRGLFRYKTYRKMCVVLQHILAREPAARSRCIPPAVGSSRVSNPFHSHMGDFALPNPSILSGRPKGLSRPLEPTRRPWRRPSPPAPNHGQSNARLITDQGSVPATPDTPMRTSSRRLHRDQPCAVWMPPSCRRWITIIESVATP